MDFSDYNQVLVSNQNTLKMTFQTKWEKIKMPFGLINDNAAFQ
jgi:hypothetical protein